MALDSYLYINTQNDISEIIPWLIENMDYKWDEERVYLLKEGLIVNVSKNEPNTRRVVYWDLTANICLYFRLDKFEGFKAGYINMIETVMLMLDFFAKEAILLGPDGGPTLLFKNGQLVLQKDNWAEQNLSLIQRSYVIQEIEEN